MYKKLTALTIGAFCVLAGCNSSIPQASEEQKKNFAGGPMPDSFRKEFEARKSAAAQDAANKARQNAPH